jgi:hypothetical protein
MIDALDRTMQWSLLSVHPHRCTLYVRNKLTLKSGIAAKLKGRICPVVYITAAPNINKQPIDFVDADPRSQSKLKLHFITWYSTWYLAKGTYF